MKTVYLGSGDFGIDCLNALVESANTPALVVTGSAHRAGRGRNLRPTPIATWAEKNSVVFVETEDVNAPEVVQKIASYEPELIVVIALGQKIGNQLISLPARAAINVHASLLPKYRGAAPINWAIVNGETETGVSIIALAEKMDSGDILAQVKTAIRQDETAGELHDRLADMAAPLLVETIAKIADGTAVYNPQEHSKATLAPKLKKSDGFLDFTESAELLRRKILGFWPWPGASAIYVSKTTDKHQQVTIATVEVVQSANPGGLATGVLDENLNVVCGEDALKIMKIKPAGSSVMDFVDFANGRATQAGDLFLKIEK